MTTEQESESSERARWKAPAWHEKLKRELPAHIFAVWRPATPRIAPSLPYPFVMIDHGCNSLLLPFKEEALTLFSGNELEWTIIAACGVSRHREISHARDQENWESHTGSDVPGGKRPLLELKRLGFHLGSQSARALGSHEKLSESSRFVLRDFLSRMGTRIPPERQHLLGQMYLREVLSRQLGDVLMTRSKQSKTLVGSISGLLLLYFEILDCVCILPSQE